MLVDLLGAGSNLYFESVLYQLENDLRFNSETMV